MLHFSVYHAPTHGLVYRMVPGREAGRGRRIGSSSGSREGARVWVLRAHSMYHFVRHRGTEQLQEARRVVGETEQIGG
jgi:hypothetical protein